MPLPNIKKFCSAKSKLTGQPCRNPAAYGCRTCKSHGAHRIRRGKDTPNYKHGHYTYENQTAYRETMKLLDQVEDLGFSAGVLKGHRTKGRKRNT